MHSLHVGSLDSLANRFARLHLELAWILHVHLIHFLFRGIRGHNLRFGIRGLPQKLNGIDAALNKLVTLAQRSAVYILVQHAISPLAQLLQILITDPIGIDTAL